MPSYSSHLIVNFLGLSTFLLLLLRYPILTLVQAGAFVVGYFAGTVFLSPDIDTKSEASKRCGLLCYPYRKLSKHRGLSHHWFWGSITRVTYLFIIISLVIIILRVWSSESMGVVLQYIMIYKLEIALIFVGLFVSNLFHILLDKVA